MDTATLICTPVELAFIKRLVGEKIEELEKDADHAWAKDYVARIKILRQKIMDAVISG